MAVLTLQPAEAAGIDTYINEANPTFNYGTSTEIHVGTNSGNNNRGLLAFDLSSIPAKASITSVILTLYCISEDSTADYTLYISRLLNPWFEGAANGAAPGVGVNGSTWNLRNANGSVAWVSGAGAGGWAGSDVAFPQNGSASISAPATAYNFDVTTVVKQFYKGTYNNYGWLLDAAAGTVARKIFASSNHATAAFRPKLAITYTLAFMEGSSAGSSTAQASLRGAKRISGSSGGSSQIFARLNRPGSMRGDTEGEATVEGSMRAIGYMHGLAEAGAIASGKLSAVGNAASGTASGSSTAFGRLTGRVKAQGISVAGAAALGTITMVGHLRGTAAGYATASGRLWGLARGVLSGAFCNPDPLLYISNGIIDPFSKHLHRLNLLEPTNGYILEDWLPTIAQYKEGGYFTDSPSYAGRRLNQRVFENPIEVLTLSLRSHSQDSAIKFIQELLLWQETAADYWTSTWADLPVYLTAKSANETNPRYAIIHMISCPQLKNPYNQPFFSSRMPAMNQLTLRIERGHWMECPPTQFECVKISSTRSWTVSGWGSSS